MVLQQSYLPIFETVTFLVEYFPYIIAVQAVLFVITKKPWRYLIILALPGIIAVGCVIAYLESNALAREEGYDMSAPTLREALNDYIATGNGDLETIVTGKKHAPVFGKAELERYLGQWMAGSVFHSTEQDAAFLPEAYNKGDDWFEATLGVPMVYTGAIHTKPDEDMWQAQLHKLDYIAHALGVKEGDRAMDIGCGWGRLSNHLASKGAKVTGVTMSSDQMAYAQRMTDKLGNNKKVDFVLKNFFDIEYPDKTFDVISSVEMAEHVGIRNYNKFLRKVHRLLKDDGTFYIQVAGLQRGYAEGYNNYQELVWGMFMDEHVFPGADASTPMGWVVTKLEQAGFEVQSSLNLGSHYSQTLDNWLKVWEKKKDGIVKAYGERSYRRWRVFLRWSVETAAKGGSTVQFITATKAGNRAARKATQLRISPGNFKLPDAGACPGGGPDASYQP